MKLRLLIVTVAILATQTIFGQSRNLKSINNIEGSYTDTINESLVIPKYNLKRDYKGNLFQNDKIIFSRNDKFEYCIYELFKDRYLVITALSKKNFTSNLSYMLPKKEIIVIDSMNWEEIHEVNIENNFIYDIYYNENGVLVLQALERIYNFKLKG
ncbi:hypothetical protein A9Q86_01480 [Flavobacteriales bacterium 33_180_T64]|nr:hypothetical protein A9Q86_01480 [Flavobacteriales bacterium 33_180_T64]